MGHAGEKWDREPKTGGQPNLINSVPTFSISFKIVYIFISAVSLWST